MSHTFLRTPHNRLMLFLTDGVKLQARNCEDSHECRLLNKKNRIKIGRQGEELRRYTVYTPSEKRNTGPFWDATALMG